LFTGIRECDGWETEREEEEEGERDGAVGGVAGGANSNDERLL
jgi:hypothetical protein